MLETVQQGFLAVQDLFVTVKKHVRMTTALLSVAYEYRGQRPLREVKRGRRVDGNRTSVRKPEETQR